MQKHPKVDQNLPFCRPGKNLRYTDQPGLAGLHVNQDLTKFLNRNKDYLYMFFQTMVNENVFSMQCSVNEVSLYFNSWKCILNMLNMPCLIGVKRVDTRLLQHALYKHVFVSIFIIPGLMLGRFCLVTDHRSRLFRRIFEKVFAGMFTFKMTSPTRKSVGVS